MAISLTAVKCPECGANLQAEEGRTQVFCSYCGCKVMITNENEHIYRHIDDAEVSRAETERVVRMKELEIEEKENVINRESRRKKLIIAACLGAGGILFTLIPSYALNSIGSMAVVAAIVLAIVAGKSGKNAKNNQHRTLMSNEARISVGMVAYHDKHYNSIAPLFQAAGFSNVNVIPLRDLTILSYKKNGMVDTVSINGNTSFKAGDIFLKTDTVTISYHSMNK